MNNILKNHLIIFPFSFFYILRLFDRISIDIEYNILLNIIFYIYILVYLIYILYFIFYIYKIFYPLILIKLIIVTILLFSYFFIENLFLTLTLYNIGDSGGIIRSRIIGDTFYQFQWYEVLFWNFIFSLYYPIYIYIFFKPFVNHLDKSINKIKKDKENLKNV